MGAAHQRLAAILFLRGDLDGSARAVRRALALARADGAPSDLDDPTEEPGQKPGSGMHPDGPPSRRRKR
jgi:hypothetical protein